MLPSAHSFDNHEIEGAQGFSHPLHALDDVNMPHRDMITRVVQERVVRFEDEAANEKIADGDRNLHDSSVGAEKGVKALYRSSVAHSTSRQYDESRWASLFSEVSCVHDCEFIAQKLPERFGVNRVNNSISDPCTPRLLHCAGAHVWHILARAARNSLHLNHSLLKVLCRPPRLPYQHDTSSGTVVSSPVDR